VGGAVARMQALDLNQPAEPAFQHEDYVIRKPVFEQKLPADVLDKVGRVHWDGGAKLSQGFGYGGFVGWLADRTCVGG